MITTFLFGYWGWGNNVTRLVSMIDEFEASAGFNPPIFVDIRHSRTVRSAGFRGDALKHIVGDHRYLWMAELGNGAIETDEPNTIKINNPEAVRKLLALAIDKAKEGRRLLAFCACHFPYFAPIDCHRAVVAELLLREARKCGLPLEVVEWPGGQPVHLQVEIDEALFRAIVKGRNFLPHSAVGPSVPGVLPYCSVLELFTNAKNYSLLAMTGPAAYQRDTRVLPVLALWSTEGKGISVAEVLALAKEYRTALGFHALRS